MSFPIDHDLCAANRFSEFVQYLAGKYGVGGKAQREIFCVEIGSGHYCGRELLVMAVGGGNESSFSALEQILAGWDMELKTAVSASNDGSHALPIFRVGDSDVGARERSADPCIHDRPSDAVGAGRNFCPLQAGGCLRAGSI